MHRNDGIKIPISSMDDSLTSKKLCLVTIQSLEQVIAVKSSNVEENCQIKISVKFPSDRRESASSRIISDENFCSRDIFDINADNFVIGLACPFQIRYQTYNRFVIFLFLPEDKSFSHRFDAEDFPEGTKKFLAISPRLVRCVTFLNAVSTRL